MSKITWQVLKNNALFWLLGSSPHPSTPDEDDSQTELLIAEEKLSPEDEGQVMPRYENWSRLCCSPKQRTKVSKLLIILKRLYFFSTTLKVWRTGWKRGGLRAGCPQRSVEPQAAHGQRVPKSAPSSHSHMWLQRGTTHGCAEAGDVASEPKGNKSKCPWRKRYTSIPLDFKNDQNAEDEDFISITKQPLTSNTSFNLCVH